MSYRNIQLIVPIQYYYGLNKTQTDASEMPFFDGDPRTAWTTFTTGDADITVNTAVAAKWCFFDGDEQIRTSGTGTYNVERAGTTVAITAFHPQYGKSAAWTVATPDFYRNSTNTEQFQSALIQLNNSTAATQWGIDIQGIMTTTYEYTKRGIVFSEDFTVPLFNRKHRLSESFKPAASRTQTGNDFSDWRAAASTQAIVVHEFSWSELTQAQFNVFQNFFNAFNGNIQQPFVMARLRNDGSAPNYEMDFWRLLIQDDSIQISKSTGDSPRYSLSFTAQELLINY